MTFWSILRQRCWGLVLVVAGVCVITFIISHLILVIRRGYWRVTAPAMLSWKIFASNWDWTSHCMYSFTATSATCFMVTGNIHSYRASGAGRVAYIFPGDAGAGFWCPAAGTPDWHPAGHTLCSLAKSLAGSSGANNGHYRNLHTCVLAWAGRHCAVYGHLQILPGGGRLDDWLDPPTHVTGFYLLDALLEGNGEVFFNALQHLILPALTLAFVHLGIVARQIRSAMLEQLSEDYIRTARASGLPGWYIVLCYALPNALIPSITVLGLALGDLLYGAVLTETVFAWPGMGAWVVTSIQALDFPAVMGFAVVVSFAYVLVNLVVDLLYLWIDPRIGRGGGE